MSLVTLIVLPLIGSLLAVLLLANARNTESTLAGLISLFCTVQAALYFPQIADDADGDRDRLCHDGAVSGRAAGLARHVGDRSRHVAGNWPAHFGSLWLIGGGMLTMAFGAIGMLGSQRLGYLAGFGAIVSSVSLLAAAGFGQPLLTAGLLYYLPSSTLAISALFLLAGLLAVAISLLNAGLRPVPVRIRRPGGVLRLLLRPGSRRHPPGFVHVALDLRDPNGLAALAMIVCMTPGTAWAELSMDRASLLLHAPEVDDASAMAAHIKQRYERPRMEIFES